MSSATTFIQSVGSEQELKDLQDYFYHEAKSNPEKGFKGLMEIIWSEATIITAIHNIKSNNGSKTAGVDHETIIKYLQQDYKKTISDVQNALTNYEVKEVRRVWIPKPGKEEKRPLGIPTIIDRIVQECIRIVIEPICEAKFFEHSYGFRPMRNTHQALERLVDVVHKTGYHWVIEGDISKFFDKVNHKILLNKLWNIGIRDKRLLMVIKQMLKAGIMDEIKRNELGTPQGGILSPLLANVYLNEFDSWVKEQWSGFETKRKYSREDSKITILKRYAKLKPAYLIRYADDWCLVTDTKENATKWFYAIEKFLKEDLKLELSKEKTLITNVKRRKIKFVGFEYKVVKSGNAKKGYVTKTEPDRERLKAKRKELNLKLRKIRNSRTRDEAIENLNIYNSSVRGIVNYYSASTHVNESMKKIDDFLTYTAYKALKRFGAEWKPAKQTTHLLSVHSEYKTQIPAITLGDAIIGATRLKFSKWEKVKLKNQKETPYSKEGRMLHQKATGNKPLKVRADELLSFHLMKLNNMKLTNEKYNFEYVMNRAYVFNRDKGKCRICKCDVNKYNVHIHHERPYLPLNEINKVKNLATVCTDCHKKIHNTKDYKGVLGKSVLKKLTDMREKLQPINI